MFCIVLFLSSGRLPSFASLGDEWHAMRKNIAENLQERHEGLQSRVNKTKAAIQEFSIRVSVM